ncbi:hypothetical protein BGP79_05605 [Tersicoccus sp. Bi-70]|nr:hypothetical protein BGP79_05605 [Tersicoccus sp. Bi-70]
MVRVAGAVTAAGLTVTDSIAALEDVRRIESWAAWAKHRLASAAIEAAEKDHERWLAASSTAAIDVDGPGLTRAERLAVGERSGVAEVACALRVSEGAVHTLVKRAEAFTGLLPLTADALRDGSITATAGMLIADEISEYADELPAVTDATTVDRLTAAIRATEAGLLSAAARGRTKAELEARARRIRQRCHPASFAERERAARADRCVRVRPDRDGMARLTALLPSAVAYRIDGRLSAIARTLQASVSADDRARGASAGLESVDDTGSGSPTIGQLRADVLVDLLAGIQRMIDDPGSSRGTRTAAGSAFSAAAAGDDCFDPVPHVLLTVPAETLAGGDDPGWLGAFGPIAAADARELASRATSFMIGVTGAESAKDQGACAVEDGTDARVVPVLATNGAQYRIPVALRRALTIRDGTCRFPGCRRSAVGCDVDHVVAWSDGGTSVAENLAHLCRKHHVLKHHSAWSVSAGPPGSRSTDRAPTSASHLTWTSPSGRRYETEPDDPPPF